MDAKFNTAAIENLVMPEDRIFLIKSLVHRFTSSDAINGEVPKAWTADFIQHKGEGQIFLLHGSPGVGKTYVSLHLSGRILGIFFLPTPNTKSELHTDCGVHLRSDGPALIVIDSR